MDDFERWIYLDGPAPEAVRAVFDPIRCETWVSAEETEEAARAIAARLAAPAPKRPVVPPRPSQPREWPRTHKVPGMVDAVPLASPDLNVRQYASLCIDLAWEPGQVDAVRRRYGVRSAAEHEALDERWRRGFARSEDLRVQFEREQAEHALRRLKIVLE